MHSLDRVRAIRFGHCEILPQQRELRVQGREVALGSRAFDLLLLLIDARAKVVTKDEILNAVWPGRIVEENTLHVQVSALRKVLRSDRHCIKTVSRWGYRFIASVAIDDAANDAHTCRSRVQTNVVAPASEAIGRGRELAVLVDLVRSHRLVTLVGTGGMGKTRLATDCARALLPQFADGVWRADLSGISDPECVPAAVAKAACLHLGQASAHDVGAAVMAKSMLVILDNCEHVAEATACVAEAISRLSTSTRVIATSREPLRAEGEHVFRVPGLAVPPGDAVATRDALEYGAMKLFMLHAGAAAEPASEAWLAAAIDVCRMLDGIPLAIELAAARLAALSIEEFAAHLAGSLQLLSGGRRTALARHQTLCACIQWSWERLSDSERIVLQRLSRFDGSFSLEEAIEAASRHALDRVAIIDAIARLVGKCLIDAETARRGLRYRLPNTARIFVREHAPEPTEVADVAYMRPKIRLLEDALATPGASPPRARSEWLPTARAYRGAIGQW